MPKVNINFGEFTILGYELENLPSKIIDDNGQSPSQYTSIKSMSVICNSQNHESPNLFFATESNGLSHAGAFILLNCDSCRNSQEILKKDILNL